MATEAYNLLALLASLVACGVALYAAVIAKKGYSEQALTQNALVSAQLHGNVARAALDLIDTKRERIEDYRRSLYEAEREIRCVMTTVLGEEWGRTLWAWVTFYPICGLPRIDGDFKRDALGATTADELVGNVMRPGGVATAAWRRVTGGSREHLCSAADSAKVEKWLVDQWPATEGDEVIMAVDAVIHSVARAALRIRLSALELRGQLQAMANATEDAGWGLARAPALHAMFNDARSVLVLLEGSRFGDIDIEKVIATPAMRLGPRESVRYLAAVTGYLRYLGEKSIPHLHTVRDRMSVYAGVVGQ